MLIRSLAAGLLCVAACAAAAQDLDLVNVTLVDGTGAEPRPGVTVSVRGGKITAISDKAPQPGKDVRRIDLGGRFLLPGLIDAHAHIQTPASALVAVKSGITTARVLGDTNLQAIGTRDLVRLGHVPGPDMLVSPGHIRPKPGTAFFMTYPQLGDAIGGELRGPERIAEATRAFIGKGADVIKVGASERAGLPDTDPRKIELTEAEMRAAVTEASKKGLYVAAHAHARDGIANAVRAGVRSIEHGTWVDDATLAEMKRRGTFFVPTLAVMSPLAEPRGHSADDIVLQLRTYHMYASLKAAVRKAHELGLAIAASTDGTYDDSDDTGRVRVAHEIALYRQVAGMTPLESITAATLTGARVLGIESRTGSIRVGMEADLVVFDGDPLAESDMLFEPRLVVSDGRILVEGVGL
ncbi:MAG TPA: amidohydrolase family protein [Steroidobacteraceae bacterium]|nr:amidohydrolase family protein [Steroidobacteraceae bacterium]